MSVSPLERPRVLLGVAQAVAAHADLEVLLRDLASALSGTLPVGYVSFALLDAKHHSARLQFIQPLSGAKLPAAESPTAHVWTTQEPLILPVTQDGPFPVLCEAFRRQGVAIAAFVPLTTPRARLGAMGFTSYEPATVPPDSIEFLWHVGRLTALAVEGALTRRELQESNRRLTEERDRLALLHEVGLAASARLDLTGLLRAVTTGLRRLHPLPLTALFTPDTDNELVCSAIDTFGVSPWEPNAKLLHGERVPYREAFRSRQPVLLVRPDFSRLPEELAQWCERVAVESLYALPLDHGSQVVGVLLLASLDETTFMGDFAAWLEDVALSVAVSVANAQAYRRIEELTTRLTAEKSYLEEEIRSEWGPDEVVGNSPGLHEILRQVEIVAPTNSTVMITGETGTGKELIARAVHRRSLRNDRTFIKLNCAAIPTGLLESELFGHEKGAYTGAVERRIGRFELADGGTLFLDEVGDIPAELQPKLLRLLQEQEFERLGSSRTIKVDVRLIAATHRNLAQMVAEGKFRSDLFYRLHVFPVHLPPLRHRREDIPALVWHFVRHFSRRCGKEIRQIPAATLAAFEVYPWPGNVRELEHLVERAVILSPGPELRIPPMDLPGVGTSDGPQVTAAHLPSFPIAQRPTGEALDAIDVMEREMIRQALQECDWVVGGPKGAANRLGLKRTTLLSRMKKFGLNRNDVTES